MRKLLLTAIVFIMTSITLHAQNLPSDMRMDVASVEQNNREYEVFIYKDNDGTIRYYLSMGRVVRLMDIFIDPELTDTSFDHVDETCLILGSTYDEAYNTLGSLLDFCKEEVGTEKLFKMRVSKTEKLGKEYVTVCRVVKKLLGGKRLDFFFAKGTFTCDLFLTKSAIKQLRWGMKLDKKLHPKQHKLE